MKKRLHFLSLFILYWIGVSSSYATENFNIANPTLCNISIDSGDDFLLINGLDAPIEIVKVFNEHWQTVYECTANCSNPLTVPNLSAGIYYVRVNTYTANWVPICESDIITATVNTSTSVVDYCTGVSVLGGVGTISISGINAPWNRVYYKTDASAEYIEICNDCANPLNLSNTSAGTYIIKVEQSDADGGNFCSVEMAAIVTPIDYCAEVGVTGGEGTLNITGMFAPWNLVFYKLVGATTYTEVCNDCANPLSISNLAAGNYIVKVQQSEGDGSNMCEVEIAATVTSSTRDYCAAVTVIGGEGTITVGGINAPWNRVSFRLASSATYTEVCNDCANPLSMTNLDAGTYVIKVDQSESDGTNACSIEIAANVTNATINYCAGVIVAGEEGQIRITGITAPQQRIQYIGPNTNGVYVTVCNDNCGDPQIIPNLLAGTYIVRIEQSGNGAVNSCTFDVLANVTEVNANGNGNNGNGNANGNGNNGNGNGNGNNGNGNANGDGNNGNGNNNESREVCAERSATNTTSCDFGTYGAYLNTFNQEVGVFYDIVDGSFVEYTDGTARFTGTLVNKQDVWIRFEIDVMFSGRTTVAGEASPKEHTCGRPQDLSTFYYYTSFSGTITGAENATGALLTIQNNGPAFQVGNGANITENRFPQPFGASGWFLVSVVNQPNDFTLNFPEDPAAQVGDFNITLSGIAQDCLDATPRSAEFTTLNAYAHKRTVDLEWLTNTSYKSAYYVLEKSTNGIDFQELEMVQNTPKGLETAYFNGLDESPVLGANFYRLKQVFQDGSMAYSRVRKVNFGVDLEAIANFPNPAQEELFMNLSEYAGKQASILISNQFGRIVEEINFEQLPSDLVKIDLSKYSNGLYLIRTKIDRTRIISQKLVVSKMY